VTSLGVDSAHDSDPMRETILQHMTIDFQCRTTLPKLNSVNKKELNQLVGKVDGAISGISTTTLEETNRLVYGAAKFVCDAVGPKGFGSATRRTPPWKIRLSKKLLALRRQLSQLIALREGQLQNERTVSTLTKKFQLNETDLNMTIESLKQQVTAVAHKIRRYDNRCLQYHQNGCS